MSDLRVAMMKELRRFIESLLRRQERDAELANKRAMERACRKLDTLNGTIDLVVRELEND